ncbi:CDP-alcohol phosphatidyltransferase family protein [Actinomadura sp. KC345]|uniref:CDP-alcohol phosphatidyltransferase family protein n=1 Tax=Actinomadura sp. KC345 TaxID=2530371 RepID=UPI001042DBE4|nr:CDP-alcohol phosphatidyltransferase family protein [Actinomadura sp. KC345]TDC47514.1 CDP-alcohol phosphatidyltransferase family protein [Actinomadura sp. KC345]
MRTAPPGVWYTAGPPRAKRLTRGPELAAAVAVQFALLAVLRPGAAGVAVGVGYALASWAVLTAAFGRRRALGPADHVTLARVVLTGGVAALVAGHLMGDGHTWALVALASVALVLDGVDGRVARRTGTASKLGARFDMEVDALLVLVLSVQVAWSAGAWVLAIGAMRYVFGAAAWAAPWLRGDLRPSIARKAVAVVQGVALTVAAAGVVPHAGALVAAALALLVWSFGRDVAWLFARRHESRRGGRSRARRERRERRGRSTDGAGRQRVLDPVAR